MIELKGAERSYRLHFGTNAFCRLEELTGRPYETVLKELRGQRPQAETIRAFVASGLIDPPALDVETVGPIVDDIGGPNVVRAAVKGLKARRRRG